MYGITLRANVIQEETWNKDDEIEVLYITSLILGATLIISTGLSFIGMMHKRVSFLLKVSAFLIVPIIFGVVFSSVFLFAEGPSIEEWIADHQESLHLTDEQVNSLHTFTNWTQWLLLGLFVNEVLRLLMFRKIFKALRNNNGNLNSFDLAREREEEADSLATKLLVEEKYSDLRQQYKDKYSFDGGYNGSFSVDDDTVDESGISSLGNIGKKGPVVIDV